MCSRTSMPSSNISSCLQGPRAVASFILPSLQPSVQHSVFWKPGDFCLIRREIWPTPSVASLKTHQLKLGTTESGFVSQWDTSMALGAPVIWRIRGPRKLPSTRHVNFYVCVCQHLWFEMERNCFTAQWELVPGHRKTRRWQASIFLDLLSLIWVTFETNSQLINPSRTWDWNPQKNTTKRAHAEAGQKEGLCQPFATWTLYNYQAP